MTATFPISWSSLRTFIFAIIVIALLCYRIKLFAKNRAVKNRTARDFELFAVQHKCRPTARPLKYTFARSLLNKAELFANRGQELLSELYSRRFSDHGSTHALYDSYGIPKVIHTIDPENVKAVISSKSGDYGVPDGRKMALLPIGGRGVVMTEGEEWLDNRKIINVGFRGARHAKGLDTAVDMLIDNLKAQATPDGWTRSCTLFHEFAQMSLDRSTEHMFGVASGLQASEASLLNQNTTHDLLQGQEGHVHIRWKETFETIASYVGVRSLLGKSAWMWDSPTFRSACAELRRLCDVVIEGAVENVKQGSENDASFVRNLVQETSDVSRIRGIVLDLFIAGHNMTAGVLTWTWFELERHPDVFAQVREEVISRFGTQDEPKEEMTWASLQRCKKLSNVVSEILRLYPTLPNVGRRAIRNTTLPVGGGPEGKDPVAVAEGTVVMGCLYLMHRREEEWHTDVEAFKPERWESHSAGSEYAPFGGGPRVCPGQAFALVELFYVTARLAQQFKAMKIPEGAEPPKRLGAGILLPPGKACLQFQSA